MEDVTMKGDEVIRKLVFGAPADLMAMIYERERLREGPSWEEILRTAVTLGILTGEEARILLQYVGGQPRQAA
jgi:hypothetical protein